MSGGHYWLLSTCWTGMPAAPSPLTVLIALCARTNELWCAAVCAPLHRFVHARCVAVAVAVACVMQGSLHQGWGLHASAPDDERDARDGGIWRYDAHPTLQCSCSNNVAATSTRGVRIFQSVRQRRSQGQHTTERRGWSPPPQCRSTSQQHACWPQVSRTAHLGRTSVPTPVPPTCRPHANSARVVPAAR